MFDFGQDAISPDTSSAPDTYVEVSDAAAQNVVQRGPIPTATLPQGQTPVSGKASAPGKPIVTKASALSVAGGGAAGWVVGAGLAAGGPVGAAVGAALGYVVGRTLFQ